MRVLAPMLSSSIVDSRVAGSTEPTFSDNGCEQSPSCLTCPLDFCKHDVSIDLQRRYKRNIEIIESWMYGSTIGELSKGFVLSRKSIHQILKNDPEDLLKSRLTCK